MNAGERASTRSGWRYAVVSVLLSLNSFACFLLYGHLHAVLIRPLARNVTWPVDAAHNASIVLAVAALVCSVVAVRRGPWWAGWIAFLLALAVGYTTLVTF